MAEPNVERMIEAALIGDRHRRQYLTDPGFHTRIDLLARLLPEWVDGMAAVSSVEQVRQRTAVMAMEHGAPGLRCPRCDSPRPNLHPAMQFEGEVQVCPHPWHEAAG